MCHTGQRTLKQGAVASMFFLHVTTWLWACGRSLCLCELHTGSGKGQIQANNLQRPTPGEGRIMPTTKRIKTEWNKPHRRNTTLRCTGKMSRLSAVHTPPAHVYLILKCLLMKLISVNTHLLCLVKDNCVVCSAVKLVFFSLCAEKRNLFIF